MSDEGRNSLRDELARVSGNLPELEVRVDHPIGETFTANTDAFQHTVTGELMHHQVGVDETCPKTSSSKSYHKSILIKSIIFITPACELRIYYFNSCSIEFIKINVEKYY